MKHEIWRNIDACYQVSNRGRVRSKTFYAKHPSGGRKRVNGRILSQAITASGYSIVSIHKGTTASVHRLVAIAFLPNTLQKPCVNHKDGDKQNNSVINLEWATYQENERHSYSALGKTAWNKGRKGRQKNHNISGLLAWHHRHDKKPKQLSMYGVSN